ncbi:MAG: sulfotransferase [Desulfobacteraceae bacterium]|nr:sulfotransferase [Desulfobacteraceae bacterium]
MKRADKKSFAPAISPLSGAHRRILKSLAEKYEIEAAHLGKWNRTLWANAIGRPFRRMDAMLSVCATDRIEIHEDPIFIIGHWRSGTTLLHNLLTQLPNTSYPSTFQSVFPNNLFFLQFIFKIAMRWFMPSERPADHVRIDPDYPQEEEIALGNEIEHSFYYWFYFPKNTIEFLEKYLMDEDPDVLEKWKINYLRFIKRAMGNIGGSRFISKNPPNTFRIKTLLGLFPNAKFIFLHRNPYEVFFSSKRFFWQTIHGLKFQEIDENTFDAFILKVYQEMMDRYVRDRGTIPKGNLIELRYQDLCHRPYSIFREITERCGIGVDADTSRKVQSFIEQGLSHVVKTYDFPRDYLEMINNRWGIYFDLFDYNKIIS